jgi:hypothetical protein
MCTKVAAKENNSLFTRCDLKPQTPRQAGFCKKSLLLTAIKLIVAHTETSFELTQITSFLKSIKRTKIRYSTASITG